MRVGILFGSAIGGITGIMEQGDVLRDRGGDRVSPYFIPSVLADAASGQIAISLGYPRAELRARVGVRDGLDGGGGGGGADPSRRRRRRARRRRRGSHAPGDPRRLLRDARPRGRGRAPAARLASVRRAPIRLRHGGGRVCARAGGAGGGPEARGEGLRGDPRLRRVERRVPPGPARAGGDGRRGDDAPGARAVGCRASPRRLHQRARHVDAARRRRRDEGDQGRLRRSRLRARRLLDEVRHGPLLRGGRRDRGDDVRARDPRGRAAADDELRAPRSGRATSTTCRTRRGRPTSTSRSNAMGLGGHNACVLVGRV